MPKGKKLSYFKCGRCRKDRQKCLPEDRAQSIRCNRCIRYDYICSPNKTMAEENMAAGGPSAVPDRLLKSTKQCLQEMGDLRCLLETSLRFMNQFPWEMGSGRQLKSRLYAVIDESIERAKRFQNEGNWGEADILYRRILQKTINSAELVPEAWDPSKPALRILEGPAITKNKLSLEFHKLHLELAVIYENIGDFAAAEEIYEFLLMETSRARLLGQDHLPVVNSLPVIVGNLVRLYILFRQRVDHMDVWDNSFPGYFQQSLPFWYILHRASVLDSEALDTALVDSFCQPLSTVPLYQHLLLCASTVSSSRIVQLLLDRQFDLETEDTEKCTALHRVVERGWADITRALLEKGAYVDCRNKWQKTPLHVAIQNGHVSIVPLLLGFGADANAQSHTGKTPLDYATPDILPHLEVLFLSRSIII